MAIPRDKALTAVREGQELAFEHHSARLPVSSASQAVADSLHALVSSGEHIRDVLQVGKLSRLPAGEDFSGTLTWYVATDRAIVHVSVDAITDDPQRSVTKVTTNCQRRNLERIESITIAETREPHSLETTTACTLTVSFGTPGIADKPVTIDSKTIHLSVGVTHGPDVSEFEKAAIVRRFAEELVARHS
jgi:hypothetical protein